MISVRAYWFGRYNNGSTFQSHPFILNSKRDQSHDLVVLVQEILGA